MRSLISFGFLKRSTNNKKVQIEALKDDIQDMEHLQSFGFVSRPLQNGEGIVLTPNGNGNNRIVIVVGGKEDASLNEGDSKIYCSGDANILCTNGKIIINNGGDTAVPSGGIKKELDAIRQDILNLTTATATAAPVGVSPAPGGFIPPPTPSITMDSNIKSATVEIPAT